MLTIKPSILKKAKRTAKQEGFASVSEYVEELIERGIKYSPPVFSTKAELLSLIDEALDCKAPSKPMTKADWKKLREELLNEPVSNDG